MKIQRLTDQKLSELTGKCVAQEKAASRKLLVCLYEVKRRRLYSDWGYPTLFKYLTQDCKYSEAEAMLRVNAVALMGRSPVAKEKIESGKIGMTTASVLERGIKAKEKQDKLEVESSVCLNLLEMTEKCSYRQAEVMLQKALDLPAKKKVNIALSEEVLAKMEKVKKYYGEMNELELIEVLLDEKIREINLPQRERKSFASETSRYFSTRIKREAITLSGGKCEKCGSKIHLQYDHRKPYGKSGLSHKMNVRVLCLGCNQREAIKVYGIDFMGKYLN